MGKSKHNDRRLNRLVKQNAELAVQMAARIMREVREFGIELMPSLLIGDELCHLAGLSCDIIARREMHSMDGGSVSVGYTAEVVFHDAGQVAKSAQIELAEKIHERVNPLVERYGVEEMTSLSKVTGFRAERLGWLPE